ncbi:MAG: DUF3108 domain-containing protein [Kiloniellales bacterium]|nr:DUF3108 domain-containing protein [Kiloniellales bacterium]
MTAAVLATLIALPVAAAARAETVSLDYLVGWGHLTIAEAEVSFSQTESSYRLIGDGRTRGILDLFVSWTGRAETEGVLRTDGRRPLVHRNRGTWNENTRTTRVDWTGEAAPRTEAEPPPDLEKVTPVPEAATVGTSDPLTVVLSVLDRLAETGRCEAEAKIWDGRRRYDISVTHLGEERLVADRPWAYDGVATRCTLQFERIGGFWREQPRWRDPDEEGAPPSRTLWVAEIAPGRWTLVRAEVETSYGTVVGRLLAKGALESNAGPAHIRQSASTRAPVALR